MMNKRGAISDPAVAGRDGPLFPSFLRSVLSPLDA